MNSSKIKLRVFLQFQVQRESNNDPEYLSLIFRKIDPISEIIFFIVGFILSLINEAYP
jgi:hypothetical protein